MKTRFVISGFMVKAMSKIMPKCMRKSMFKSMSKFIIKAVAICAVLSLGGCFVYKVDVQQGNDITAQIVAQLEIGMTKREVARIAGFPLINDPFHKNRWDYYYSRRNGQTGEIEQRLASLKFTGDLLSEITSTFD